VGGGGPAPLAYTHMMTANDALLDLNDNPSLDLLASHNAYFTADDNVNPYENLNITSSYYGIPSFSSSFQKSKSPISSTSISNPCLAKLII
jgi:hypothetical protein